MSEINIYQIPNSNIYLINDSVYTVYCELPATVPDIVEKLNVTKQFVYKIINALCEANFVYSDGKVTSGVERQSKQTLYKKVENPERLIYCRSALLRK